MKAILQMWYFGLLLVTSAVILDVICSCNGAPLPTLFKIGTLSREKRGIFGQLTSVTTTTTSVPKFRFGTKGGTRTTAKKVTAKTTTTVISTSMSTSNYAAAELVGTSPDSNIPETSTHGRSTTEETEKTSQSTVSSSPSPVYINPSPSALMLQQTEQTTDSPKIVISSTTPDETSTTTSTTAKSVTPKTMDLRKDDEETVANNRALSPSSIWNLIVVLLQLAYTVTQQKIPP